MSPMCALLISVAWISLVISMVEAQGSRRQILPNGPMESQQNQICATRAQAAHQCMMKVDAGVECTQIRQRRQYLGQQCLNKNAAWKPCYEQLSAVKHCVEVFLNSRFVESKPQKEVREKMMSDYNQCFKKNPSNPFYVCRPPGHNPNAKTVSVMRDVAREDCGKRAQANDTLIADDHTPEEESSTDSSQETCDPFIECLQQSEMKLASEPKLTSLAKKVFQMKQRCKMENVPTYECYPSTEDQRQCISQARKAYVMSLRENMATCIREQGAGLEFFAALMNYDEDIGAPHYFQLGPY